MEVDLKLRCEWMDYSKLRHSLDSMSQTYLRFARLQTNMPSSSGCKDEKAVSMIFQKAP